MLCPVHRQKLILADIDKLHVDVSAENMPSGVEEVVLRYFPCSGLVSK